jgi:hypothetical protein
VKTLAALGYRVDSSVVPEFSYHSSGGPTFFGRPTTPYWLDAGRQVLELPLTSTHIGRLADESRRHLANGLFENDARYALSRSLLARTGLMERIRLTPEGTDVSDAKRLVRALLKRGTRVFTLSYHTPSLQPGNTPYVRSRADRDRFIGWFEEFYEFFLGEVGGAPATINEIYAHLAGIWRRLCHEAARGIAALEPAAAAGRTAAAVRDCRRIRAAGFLRRGPRRQ